MVLAAAILVAFSQVANSQIRSILDTGAASEEHASVEPICDVKTQNPAQAALLLVCRRAPLADGTPLPSQTIVVGFLGGFANPEDVNHPEVLFAAYLREHYAPGLHAEIFSNRDRRGALRYVIGLLDINHDGFVSDEEKSRARIIIYGHSWGASETAAFARLLQRSSIPVLVTIQLDTVPKWGQHPSRIPSNVESAINFFQSEGFLQGSPKIVASDTTRTEILGNFHYTYRGRPINCDNYPWLARTFNKPHHEIENDPGVWNRIASLIDANIAGNRRGATDPPANPPANTATSANDVNPPPSR